VWVVQGSGFPHHPIYRGAGWGTGNRSVSRGNRVRFQVPGFLGGNSGENAVFVFADFVGGDERSDGCEDVGAVPFEAGSDERSLLFEAVEDFLFVVVWAAGCGGGEAEFTVVEGCSGDGDGGGHCFRGR